MEKYRVLCKEAGIAVGKLNSQFLFTVENADYFYFNKNIGVTDILDGFVDGSGDGGIDFLYTYDDVLYLMQGKSSESISIDEIKNLYNKMIITIEKMSKNKTKDLNPRLVTNYLNAYDTLSDSKNIALVLFTNATTNKSLRDKIKELKDSENYAKYNILIYDAIDIESKKMTSDDKEFVDEYKLDLIDSNNSLRYNNNGCIVNISANSLKKLYQSKSRKGLFSYNLREHIKQANVDNAISRTIKDEPDNFWFYNNGITIGCEDYTPDGTKMKLYNFSIINGAQTTTKIGESDLVDSEHDFAIVCKIVKPDTSLKSDSEFLTKISEASNSQKPIKPRDLKANLPEQKILQKKAATNSRPLAIEIKRGLKPDNFSRVEPWQRVSNDLIGQLILACILQRPGDAKASSSSLFDNQAVYTDVFRRKHDYNTLYDLAKLYKYYEDFRVGFEKDNDEIDQISVSKSGRYTILAVIFYLLKRFNKIIDDRRDEKVSKDNIAGNIFAAELDDDFQERLSELFEYIIKIINDVYQNKKVDLKLTSHASFLKNDSYYIDYILKEFDKALDNKFDQEKINYYMVMFNSKMSVGC